MVGGRGRMPRTSNNLTKPTRLLTLLALALASCMLLLVALGCASDEGSSDVTLDEARTLYEQGEFEQAAADLEALIDEDGNDLPARRVLALTYSAQGKNDEAIEQYVFVVGADSEDHVSFYRMALLERLIGRVDDSILHLETASEIKEDRVYLDELARTYVTVGRYEDAIAAWDVVLEDETLEQEIRVEVLKLQAQAYADARMYAEAKAALEKALFLAPNDETIKTRLDALGGSSS